jgi:hypothetical protein
MTPAPEQGSGRIPAVIELQLLQLARILEPMRVRMRELELEPVPEPELGLKLGLKSVPEQERGPESERELEWGRALEQERGPESERELVWGRELEVDWGCAVGVMALRR